MSARSESNSLVVGGEPRIDFLPLETKMRKENRRRRRSYVALLVAVTVACVVAVTFTVKGTADAQAALASEQARTASILDDQKEYAEVLTVRGELSSVAAARLVGSANDILWADVIEDVVDTLEAPLPYAFNIDSQSVEEAPLVLEEPLQKPAIATVFLTFAVPDLATADAVIANLPDMPAFADATATSTTWDKEKGFYRMNITLHITADALELRYFKNKPEKPSDSDSEEETDSPTAEETNSPTTEETNPPSTEGTDSETDGEN